MKGYHAHQSPASSAMSSLSRDEGIPTRSTTDIEHHEQLKHEQRSHDEGMPPRHDNFEHHEKLGQARHDEGKSDSEQRDQLVANCISLHGRLLHSHRHQDELHGVTNGDKGFPFNYGIRAPMAKRPGSSAAAVALVQRRRNPCWQAMSPS